MKKIFALLLALAMTLALVACGGNAANSGDGAASSAPSGDPAASTPADNEGAADADAGEMKLAAEGVLTMGTNAAFPPYEFYDGETIVGIDAEIAAAIAEKLGLTLEIVDMDFNSLIGAVQSGKIDVSLAGMTVTEDRLLNVDFSTSYATGVQVVIVPEDSSITSVDDLYTMLDNGEDLMIGCQEATTGYIYASSSVEDGGFGEDHVTPYTNGATAVQAKVDCVIIDNQPAKAFVEANEGLKILDTEYVTEDYAIAVSKDNNALLEAIDTALVELIEDGTVQAILDKYITAD